MSELRSRVARPRGRPVNPQRLCHGMVQRRPAGRKPSAVHVFSRCTIGATSGGTNGHRPDTAPHIRNHVRGFRLCGRCHELARTLCRPCSCRAGSALLTKRPPAHFVIAYANVVRRVARAMRGPPHQWLIGPGFAGFGPRGAARPTERQLRGVRRTEWSAI